MLIYRENQSDFMGLPIRIIEGIKPAHPKYHLKINNLYR